MNVLPRDKQTAIIAALCEGVSIRSTERLTGVHRDTIMRLGVRVGMGCAQVHDALMRDLAIARLEVDEIGSFVGKKQPLTTPADGAVNGDQSIFTAIAATAKAIVGYRIGKRNDDATEAFCHDLRARILGPPEASTDGFTPYTAAIRRTFGPAVSHGIILKKYASHPHGGAARRYSPGHVVSVQRDIVSGNPMHISTSYVERQNLSMRMGAPRLTRLTNAFSKKLENHVAAVNLSFAHYNLCRVHETGLTTPAGALGVADHVWTIGELLDAGSQWRNTPANRPSHRPVQAHRWRIVLISMSSVRIRTVPSREAPVAIRRFTAKTAQLGERPTTCRPAASRTPSTRARWLIDIVNRGRWDRGPEPDQPVTGLPTRERDRTAEAC